MSKKKLAGVFVLCALPNRVDAHWCDAAGRQERTFAFSLPPRKGDALRRILATDSMQDLFGAGKRTKGRRIVLKAKVDTEIFIYPRTHPRRKTAYRVHN